MIQLNPRYEAIFNPDNIDQDCDRIASLMNVEADFIKEALDAGLYKQAVTMYLQLLKSDAESLALLDEGHKEILQSECYQDYGIPSYIDR